MNRQHFIFGLILIGLCLALNQAAIAHHSTTYYALEPKTIQGTVVEFRWRNPHAVVVWDANGLTKDSLKQGDEIIFNVRPSKAGTPAAVIQSMKRPNGTWVLRWSTQSETGLSKEQVEKLRVDAGLPKEGPGRSAPERQ